MIKLNYKIVAHFKKPVVLFVENASCVLINDYASI